jgi:UDP-glucose 4-epimerase
MCSDKNTILITGASGQIGRSVSEILRNNARQILPIDIEPEAGSGVFGCDLRSEDELARLLENGQIRTVIHLAGVLPSAFERNPLDGADVNLNGTLTLMRQAAEAGVTRFVFSSSMSVYGTTPSHRPLTEDDPAAPDDSYGASKRAIELIGEALSRKCGVQFVSLRIARVVGPGVKKSSSRWRSQIFDGSKQEAIKIPFSPEAMLSLVYVEDVAHMMITLADARTANRSFYNTPAEIWRAEELKKTIEELRGIPVYLERGGPLGGPMCDGSRFAQEFGFQLRGLRDRLSALYPG